MAVFKVISCGVDIGTISDLRMILDTDKMRNAIFHEQELAICADWSASRKDEFLAGRFCAKEAIFKAISEVSDHYQVIRLNQIAVLRSNQQQPVVRLNPEGLDAPPLNVKVSISHKDDQVIAFSIAQRQ